MADSEIAFNFSNREHVEHLARRLGRGPLLWSEDARGDHVVYLRCRIGDGIEITVPTIAKSDPQFHPERFHRDQMRLVAMVAGELLDDIASTAPMQVAADDPK